MSQDDLLRALETVHQELSQTKHLDPEEVERLRATMRDIEAALDATETEESSFADRVAESARSFEESHPRLTEVLGRVADMLQQMGI